MPVPIPGSKVGSDSLKVKFLMIFGRPKIGFFGQISGAPGYIPPTPASYQPRRLTQIGVKLGVEQTAAWLGQFPWVWAPAAATPYAFSEPQTSGLISK